MWTGIPVFKLTEAESQKLIRMEEELHKRVIGQEPAIVAVSKAIRRARAGIKDPKRPTGSFIFLGPSGVGKTELARTLAEFLFGDEDAMIQVDMSEYMEKHSVSRLVGSPPGYVGYDEGGQLTEAVRRKPYSVLLLDEIEKAHPDVFNILLQILEDGKLTDSQGRKVDFRNTIVIMTSNIGAAQISKNQSLGFTLGDEQGLSYDDMKSRVMGELKKVFRPELLNRIDEIIVFHKLEKSEILQIVDLMMKRLRDQMTIHGATIELTDAARELLVEQGYDPAMGARPLRRSIQRLIEDPLADFVLGRELGEGSTILIDRRQELTGVEGESLVEIQVIDGVPQPVTVPADEESPELPDAPPADPISTTRCCSSPVASRSSRVGRPSSRVRRSCISWTSTSDCSIVVRRVPMCCATSSCNACGACSPRIWGRSRLPLRRLPRAAPAGDASARQARGVAPGRGPQGARDACPVPALEPEGDRDRRLRGGARAGDAVDGPQARGRRARVGRVDVAARGSVGDPRRGCAADGLASRGCDHRQPAVPRRPTPAARARRRLRRMAEARVRYADVVRPYLVGDDIANDPAQHPGRFIVDFSSMPLEQAMDYPDAIRIVQLQARTDREGSTSYHRNPRWWQFLWPRPVFRTKVAGLRRFLAGTATGKRILFCWCSPDAVASNATNVFALAEDYDFGMVTSAVHIEWARSQSSTLEDRIRYTPSSAFETFPWPDGNRDEIANDLN